MQFATLASLLMLAAQPNAQEIIQRSVEANQANWKEEEYSFTERDVEIKDDAVQAIKTYDVLMIRGSPYQKLIAENDQPLSPVRRAEETRKFQRELRKRGRETKEERERRISTYRKERDEERALLREMTEALTYSLIGEDRVGGRDVWVLEATAKPGYQPRTREAKILTGMTGKLWVEKSGNQWVRVEAQVVKPVAFLGFVAKVSPGTSFVLEQAPVNENLWLPAHFQMRVDATILGVVHRKYGEDDTYSNYRIEAFP